jgi:hypothetical protein
MLFSVTFCFYFYFLLFNLDLYFFLLYRFFLNFFLFLLNFLLFFSFFVMTLLRRLFRIITRILLRLIRIIILIVGNNKVIFLFCRNLVFIDLLRISPFNFFEHSFELDSIIRILLKHHLGLIILFLFLFLLFDFFHL